MKYRVASDPADALERFVWVNDDGSLRELSRDECAYLATPFEGPDGGRPYVKESYRSLTPDGRMRGFLELRHLPEELHYRVRRGGGAPPPRPRSLVNRRVVVHTLGAIFATTLAGYLALIVGAFLALPFMRPGYRGLGIVLFAVAVFFSLPFYLLFGPINVLGTADSLRFIRFFATTAAWLGAIAGATWVLWLHGDPTRILMFR